MSGTDRSEHGGISAPCPLAAALVDGGEPKDPRYSWVGLELIPDAVPEGLKAIEQWVPWKAVPRVGRPGMDKVPYQTNGAKAKSSDPSTWSDWNSVLKCLESDGDEPSEYSGPGFMFRAENGLIGLDWDHVRDPGTGVIDEVAAAAIAYIGGYSEVSPSGTGVRVIGRGTLASAITSATLQGWSSGRFVTVTGHRLPGSSADIQDIDPVRLAEIVDYYAPAKPAPSQAIAGACQDLDVQQVLEIRAALGHLPVDNYPLMIEMGMCLHSTGARNAFGIWNEWCLASDKYDGLKAKRAKWAGFGRDAEGVQLRTLFFRAAEHGWVNPASRQAVAFAAATPGPATAALGKPAGAPGARETPQKGLSADEGAELLNHLDQSGRATPAYSWPKVSLGSGNYTAPFLSIAAECGLDGFLRGLEEYLPRRAATVERSHAAALAKGQPITPDMPEDEIREQAAAWLERVRTLQVSDERGRALLERVRAGVTAEDVPLEV